MRMRLKTDPTKTVEFIGVNTVIPPQSMDEWRLIKGFEHYAISPSGIVGRATTNAKGKITCVKPLRENNKYWTPRITLYAYDENKRYASVQNIAELVLETFDRKRPKGHAYTFKDKNPKNVSLDNLIWIPKGKAADDREYNAEILGRVGRRKYRHKPGRKPIDIVTHAVPILRAMLFTIEIEAVPEKTMWKRTFAVKELLKLTKDTYYEAKMRQILNKLVEMDVLQYVTMDSHKRGRPTWYYRIHIDLTSSEDVWQKLTSNDIERLLPFGFDYNWEDKSRDKAHYEPKAAFNDDDIEEIEEIEDLEEIEEIEDLDDDRLELPHYSEEDLK